MKVVKSILLLLLICIPILIFRNTDYLKDVIDSILIGLAVSITAILASARFKKLTFNEFSGERDIVLNDMYFNEMGFKTIFKLNKLTLVRDSENRTFIWIKKNSDNIYSYYVSSSLLPIMNSKLEIEKSILKLNEMMDKIKSS